MQKNKFEKIMNQNPNQLPIENINDALQKPAITNHVISKSHMGISQSNFGEKGNKKMEGIGGTSTGRAPSLSSID